MRVNAVMKWSLERSEANSALLETLCCRRLWTPNSYGDKKEDSRKHNPDLRSRMTSPNQSLPREKMCSTLIWKLTLLTKFIYCLAIKILNHMARKIRQFILPIMIYLQQRTPRFWRFLTLAICRKLLSFDLVRGRNWRDAFWPNNCRKKTEDFFRKCKMSWWK